MKRLETLRRTLAGREAKRIEASGSIQTSVGVLLAPAGAGLELLFIRRAEHPLDPWSGHIALPGGRRDPGDKDRLETAVRETLEETGLRLRRDWVLGELDDVQPRTPALPSVAIRPFVFQLPRREPTTASAEVAECLWAPLEALRLTSGRAKVPIRGLLTEVPVYLVGERVVWGLTQRILSQLFELL